MSTVLPAVIMCLHARSDETDRATWPTLRLVTEVMGTYRLASASRVHDLVARLIKTGYIEQHVAPQDRRLRILVPTAKMLEQDLDFLASHHLPLQIYSSGTLLLCGSGLRFALVSCDLPTRHVYSGRRSHRNAGLAQN